MPGPTLGTDQAAHASVHEFQEDEKPLLVISNYGNRRLRYAGGHHKYPANLERDQGELVPVAVITVVILREALTGNIKRK